MAFFATADVGVAQFARIARDSLEQSAGDHETGADAAGPAVDVDQMIGIAVIAEPVFGDRADVGIVGRKDRQSRCCAEHLADLDVMPVQVGRQLHHRLPAVHQPRYRDADGCQRLPVV